LNASTREAAVKKKITRLIVITVVVSVLIVGAALFARAKYALAADQAKKKLEEAKKAAERVENLAKGADAVAEKLTSAEKTTEWAVRLAADEKQRDELEAQGFYSILAERFDSELLRALDDLANRTNVRFVSVKPGDYKVRAPRKKPYDTTTDEAPEGKKKAEEGKKKAEDKKKKAYDDLPPEKKRPYEKDETYKAWNDMATKAADVRQVDITLRGTYGGIFDFIKGLAYPRAGKRFHLLVAIRNIRLSVEQTAQAISGEPILTANLYAVAFAVHPPQEPKDKGKGAGEEDSKTSTEGKGRDAG